MEITPLLLQIHQQHEEQIMALPNVVGFGIGDEDGTPIFHVLVVRKQGLSTLAVGDRIPPTIGVYNVRVLEVGQVLANGVSLTKRVRPMRPGFSIGHVDITAGTIGTFCYDLLPGATIDPPANGRGTPSKYYLLSNNHVLANSNKARLGDPIVQPGPFDGGRYPNDVVGYLRRYIPIEFAPSKPLSQHNNVVDAAIAEVDLSDLNRRPLWMVAPLSWARKSRLAVNDLVMKNGRTSGFSTGNVLSLSVTIDVGYGNGQTARFKDQFLVTNISAGGDSGSIVTDKASSVVGLVFAGSTEVTVCNHFENVRGLLRIEVSETMV